MRGGGHWSGRLEGIMRAKLSRNPSTPLSDLHIYVQHVIYVAQHWSGALIHWVRRHRGELRRSCSTLPHMEHMEPFEVLTPEGQIHQHDMSGGLKV
jgi:hypothetical protein